jgi:hypothetical protein
MRNKINAYRFGLFIVPLSLIFQLGLFVGSNVKETDQKPWIQLIRRSSSERLAFIRGSLDKNTCFQISFFDTLDINSIRSMSFEKGCNTGNAEPWGNQIYFYPEGNLSAIEPVDMLEPNIEGIKYPNVLFFRNGKVKEQGHLCRCSFSGKIDFSEVDTILFEINRLKDEFDRLYENPSQIFGPCDTTYLFSKSGLLNEVRWYPREYDLVIKQSSTKGEISTKKRPSLFTVPEFTYKVIEIDKP